MGGCRIFMSIMVFAVFLIPIGSVVIRNFYADICGNKLCPYDFPTVDGEKEKESPVKCSLLDKDNITVWHIVQESFEVHWDCVVDVMKVVHETAGFWTGSKYGHRITWSLKTEGKLFRVVCDSLVVYVKFHGVDQDSLGTTSPRPYTTRSTDGQSSTLQVATTKPGSSTVRGHSSMGTTQLSPKREEHGQWYVGVGVGVGVGVVVVLILIIVFICKRKKRGVVYGGIELGSINAASEEETPL